jgi:hypothetical protein
MYIAGISVCRKTIVMDLQIEVKRVNVKRAVVHYENRLILCVHSRHFWAFLSTKL